MGFIERVTLEQQSEGGKRFWAERRVDANIPRTELAWHV